MSTYGAAPIWARHALEVVALPSTARTNRTRTAAAKAARGKGGRNAESEGRFVPGPEFTPNMVAKAKRLINKGLFARVDKGVCQVASSDGSSYLASMDPNNCQCVSFKIRRICSHVLVVQMVDAASGAGVVSRAGSGGQ